MGLRVENKRPGPWVKDHIWSLDSCKCIFCCLWRKYINHNSPVKQCCPVWPSTLQTPNRQQRRSSWPRIRHLPWAEEAALKPPFPRLWSIRPLMNETAVKGHKAGVHACACVCSCSLEVFCQFPENMKSPGAARVLLSFTTHSVGDKTHGCTQTNYGSRMGCYQSRQKNPSHVKFWGHEQYVKEWNKMLRSTCWEKYIQIMEPRFLSATFII